MRERIRELLTPSMRFEIRKSLNWARDIMGRACLWRWEVARFRLQTNNDYEVLYVGRKDRKDMAKLLIGGKLEADASSADGAQQATGASHTVLISEMPSAGALYVPHYLSAVIP